MTAFTTKERAQINAALCIIHDSGNSASAIVAAAKANLAAGHPPMTAYGLPINAFAAENAHLAPAMTKIMRLIGASSEETIGSYDRALSEYIETGDNAALQRLAPMIATDSIALAIQHGEMTAAEAGTTGLATALGSEPTAAMREALAGSLDPLVSAPARADPTAQQVSAIEGPGLVAAKAQMGRSHYEGFVRDAAPTVGLTVGNAREAARAASAGRSQAAIDTTARA